MNPIFVRAENNYDMDEASKASGLTCKDKTLAQQQFKDECDINVIVERFGLSGEMPEPGAHPLSGDYTGIFDFQTAMNTVVRGRETFMALPAKMRARSQNDPQQLLQFLEDEENRPEAEKLGLVKPPEPEPAPAPATTPAPTPEPAKT